MLSSILGIFIAFNNVNACPGHDKDDMDKLVNEKAHPEKTPAKSTKKTPKKKQMTKEEALKQEDKDKGLYE